MSSYGSAFGRLAVIVLCGAVFVGDLIFVANMAQEVFR